MRDADKERLRLGDEDGTATKPMRGCGDTGEEEEKMTRKRGGEE